MKRTRLSITGFTLVEMAIVLLIVALLMGGLLPTLSGQVEQRRHNETGKQLDEIQQALTGYAVINGRLPCPAFYTDSTNNSNGQESFCANATGSCGTPQTSYQTHGKCSNFYSGYVPAATLGLQGTDSSGYAVDSWGNRIRYAVSSWSSTNPNRPYVFTSQNGMGIVGVSNPLAPNLSVCSSAPTNTGTSCAAGTSLTANGVPAVIFSTGKNGGNGGSGTDEAANLDGTNVTFVSHAPTLGANEFDDIVIWMSPNVLINRMVVSGKLP